MLMSGNLKMNNLVLLLYWSNNVIIYTAYESKYFWGYLKCNGVKKRSSRTYLVLPRGLCHTWSICFRIMNFWHYEFLTRRNCRISGAAREVQVWAKLDWILLALLCNIYPWVCLNTSFVWKREKGWGNLEVLQCHFFSTLLFCLEERIGRD